jgi:hypothetical protein
LHRVVTRNARKAGYAIVLVAVVAFAVAALGFDYYTASGGGSTRFEVSSGRAELLSLRGVSAVLVVLGGPALIAVLCLRRLGSRSETSPAPVVAAVAVWAIYETGGWLGLLDLDLVVDIGRGPGYWAQIATVALAVVGAVVCAIPERDAGVVRDDLHPAPDGGRLQGG